MKCSIYQTRVRSDGWVFLRDLKLSEKMNGRKSALREHRQVEEWIVDEGLHGWIAATDIDNSPMIGLFYGLGAQPYFCDGEEIVFFKELNHVKSSEHSTNPNDEPRIQTEDGTAS